MTIFMTYFTDLDTLLIPALTSLMTFFYFFLQIIDAEIYTLIFFHRFFPPGKLLSIASWINSIRSDQILLASLFVDRLCSVSH